VGKDTVEVAVVDKGGRPCKYESHVEPYLDKIYEWLKQGYTDYSIAEQLGIHPVSFIRYKERYDNLASLYTRATHERNRLVMNKMFQRATGEKVTLIKQKATKDGEILDLVEEQYIPPDVNAADLYLRNNDPEYKNAKSDVGNLTLIQNNFQLPQISQQLMEIENQLKSLESPSAVDVEAIE
jgi:hypothetical protein